MKTDIHPTYHPEAKVICACGIESITGGTKPEVRVEVCSNCHPFWTGEQRIVDTEGRVERLMRRYGMSMSSDGEDESSASDAPAS